MRSELLEVLTQHHRSAVPGLIGIVLYGSRARGTARPNSDLDLFLLAETLPSDGFERAKLVHPPTLPIDDPDVAPRALTRPGTVLALEKGAHPKGLGRRLGRSSPESPATGPRYRLQLALHSLESARDDAARKNWRDSAVFSRASVAAMALAEACVSLISPSTPR